MGSSSKYSRIVVPTAEHQEHDKFTERSSSHKHRSAIGDGRHHKSRLTNRDEEHRKHLRDREETEEERKERRRSKKETRRREKDAGLDVVDDDDDGEVWVEKGIDISQSISSIPSSDSLPLRSHVSQPSSTALPAAIVSGSQSRERESWMLESGSLPGPSSTSVPAPTRDIPRSAGRPSSTTPDAGGLMDGHGDDELSNRNVSAGVDFFSSLGTEHKRKDPNESKPDPSKVYIDRRELNVQLKEGRALDEYEVQEKKKAQPGGPGYQWRMMKLKRLYEQAEEQGQEPEDVAIERYGSLDEFHEALEERRILDEREQRRRDRRGNTGSDGAGVSSPGSTSGMRTPDVPGGRRYMFANPEEGGGSRPGSRASFRRPGESDGVQTPGGSRIDQLRGAGGVSTPGTSSKLLPPQNRVSTPIPSVFTPQSLTRQASGYPFDTPPNQTIPPSSTMSHPPLSTEQLNKLQARVLRAKLMDDPDASALEEEYEVERARAAIGGGDAGGAGMWEGSGGGAPGQMGREQDGTRVDVQVLPTLDGQGRLYDVGIGKDDGQVQQGNKRKKPEKFETRDRQGNLLRYNGDDDEHSLGELVRQEKFGGGSADQKDLNAEMARAIATDGKYQDDLDYMDDNAERLARRKMKSDAMKRAFAINDFARTKKALDTCPFCYQDDRPPLAAIVALGTRTYLCCTQTEELVPGHCLIVPLQHHLSTLEMEDDDWDEIRNFMKCLMRMHAKDNKGVLFFETILSFKQQKHTFIEAVPVPFEQFQDAPAYFRESILASESEWTQHKKLIDFSLRPGGFRRAMVPNLPYFMVQWDYKGEKGYGHVIEGVDDASGRGQGEDEMGGPVDEGDKGGGEFPKWFATEIIGNLLSLEPRKWRRPRKMDYALNKERARGLGTLFQPFDWTVAVRVEGE